jgi:hypothetical protein
MVMVGEYLNLDVGIPNIVVGFKLLRVQQTATSGLSKRRSLQ